MISGVYMITNNVNQKKYIGVSADIYNRLYYHKVKSINNNDKEYEKTLYRAFRKHGIENFSFSILEECPIDIMYEKEKYYIKKYDSHSNGYNETDGGENPPILKGEEHGNASLTDSDVLDIRKRYLNIEKQINVYQDYKDKITFRSFQNIWQGRSWKHIMPEIYTEENIKKHVANSGSEVNGQAKLTKEDVLDIRVRLKNGEDLNQILKDYNKIITKQTITKVAKYKTWKNIIPS